ncbi:MAG: hypothetical protein AAFW01_00020 [Pseudomonadota bacterium]
MDVASAVEIAVAHGVDREIAWRLMPSACDGFVAGVLEIVREEGAP